MVVSPAVLLEYRRVADELASRARFPDVDRVLDLIALHAVIVEDRPLKHPLCRDPHDDKFIACAVLGRAVVVSGDRDLQAVDGAVGIEVLSPRAFWSRIQGPRR